MKTYIIFFKNGREIKVAGEALCETVRDLVIYQNADYTEVVARFYKDSIAGFAIEITEREDSNERTVNA